MVGLQNIAEMLSARAKEMPHTKAVMFPVARDRHGVASYRHLTYQELDEESTILAAGLWRFGIAKGDKIALMVTPSLEFFSLTFALFKAGALPVLIDPGIGITQLNVCLAEAKPHAFIGIPKAHLARIIMRWPRLYKHGLITVGKVAIFGGITLNKLRQLGLDALSTYEAPRITKDDEAAILFTSGSTGAPKGVIYHHRHFLAQVRLLQEQFAITAGEFDLCTFPLFALFAPALGMSAVIPTMDFTRPGSVDPKMIFAPFRDFPITNMFGSPALLKRIALSPEAQGLKLSTLKRVISAGAPVGAPIIAAMKQLMPENAQIYTPYGATEALPIACIGSDEILQHTAAQTQQGRGICVGRPHPQTTVQIIAISDDPIATLAQAKMLAPFEIGEIIVAGEQVTTTYYGRPGSNMLAKILDPSCGKIYHRMGDLGYFDEKGRLWFCGRKSHRVIAADRELYTIQTEAIFNNHSAVARSALVGIKTRGRYQLPVLCIEPNTRLSPLARERVTTELLALARQHNHTRAINTFLFHKRFPVDIRHNAKIFREKLAVWAKDKV